MRRRKLKKPVKRTLILLLCMFAAVYVIANHKSLSHESIFEPPIPKKFIPVYKAAGEKYGIPWELLAAHHRIETKFSQMDPMLSPVGAEGPLQFMPCTFVGWGYPSCSGLGKGEIPKEDKTNPAVIKKYGGYGVDANGDGKADPYNIEDAVFSAAFYLKEHGAANGELEKAVYAYNHSRKYVDDVLYYFYIYKSKE